MVFGVVPCFTGGTLDCRGTIVAPWNFLRWFTVCVTVVELVCCIAKPSVSCAYALHNKGTEPDNNSTRAKRCFVIFCLLRFRWISGGDEIIQRFE
jgi:hypothetical protein